MLRSLCLILLIVLMSATTLFAQNLVWNGEFESPYLTIEEYRAVDPLYWNIPGWTVEDSSVDVIGSYWQAAQGNQSLDLSGNQPGIIYQMIINEAGDYYNLRFAMAGNPDFASVKTMQVWWGSALIDKLEFDTTGYTRTNMGWTYHNYTVRGTGYDKLRFVSLGGPGCYGPALDDITLTLAVPEPSTLLALMIGLGGFGGTIRRRK